jgi:hypothetical protein
MRAFLWVLYVLCLCGLAAAQTAGPDSLRAPADTIYVIPAGPVAGTFTSAARVTVEDTIAGWAKIRMEGWVPFSSVANRFAVSSADSSAVIKSSGKTAARHQCEAITKKGTRCKRMAEPGSRFCWQHQK